MLYFKTNVIKADRMNASPVNNSCERNEFLLVAVCIAPAKEGPNLAAVMKKRYKHTPDGYFSMPVIDTVIGATINHNK